MREGRNVSIIEEKLALLPDSPGVYIMENRAGDVIYVGKSRSLRDRVSQYFHGSHGVKTAKMASNVNNFRYIVCDSEMDALVLENDLLCGGEGHLRHGEEPVHQGEQERDCYRQRYVHARLRDLLGRVTQPLYDTNTRPTAKPQGFLHVAYNRGRPRGPLSRIPWRF